MQDLSTWVAREKQWNSVVLAKVLDDLALSMIIDHTFDVSIACIPTACASWAGTRLAPTCNHRSNKNVKSSPELNTSLSECPCSRMNNERSSLQCTQNAASQKYVSFQRCGCCIPRYGSSFQLKNLWLSNLNALSFQAHALISVFRHHCRKFCGTHNAWK